MLLAGGASRLVRGYQIFVSTLLPRACRFVPSCSEYARQVFLSHGFFRGAWLSLCRLARCNPFCAGGYDPPPGGAGGA
jgi:putative membrane protein insertion efficiency factor